MQSAAPPCRTARTVALTATAVTVGVVAHVLGGGAVTTAGVVAAVVALVGPSWFLTGRERGWLALAGAQLAGQQVVHTLLGHSAPPAPMPDLPVDLFLYGHVAAAALVAVWLRSGERKAWVAARRVARAVAAHWRQLLALLGVHTPSGPAPRTPVPAAPVVPRHVPLRHAMVRRGPPALA